MICPNLDGSESPTYAEHNDAEGLAARLRVMNCHEARLRYLAALAEFENNDITLYMSRHELQQRLYEARRQRWPWVYMWEFAQPKRSRVREIACDEHGPILVPA